MKRPRFRAVRCTCISEHGKRIVADPDCPFAEEEARDDQARSGR